MEVDLVVETVLEGRTSDNGNLNQRVQEQLAKLTAKINATGNASSSSLGKSIFDRIHQAKAVFEWENFKPLFEEVKDSFQKSTEVSSKLREKGNEFYKQKNLESALRAYSLAIAFSPDDSEQLPIAYANRSAVLLQKSQATESLADIERAISHQNCPEKLKGALQGRKLKCEAILKKVNNGNLIPINENMDLINTVGKLFIIRETQTKIPNAAACVRMEYTPEKGRHLILTEDVDAGCTLLVDNPFVSVLDGLLEWETNHCHFCSGKMLGGIPCNSCTFAMFCSEKCRKRACDTDGMHRFEHHYLPILHHLKSSHGDLQAMRIIGLIGPVNAYDMCKNRAPFQEDSTSCLMGFNQDGVYDANSYLPIFRLISHEHQQTSSELGSRAGGINTTLKALVLQGIIKEYSQFFDGHLKSSEAQQFEDFIAALLLKHLENVKYNAISLSKLSHDKQKSTAYATAVYPLISLCNHSCDPNCAPVKQSRNLKTSLVTLKPMKKGDELSITYKPLYTFMKTSERQKFLAENYLFICNCQACEQNWGPGNIQAVESGATLILEPTRCASCPPSNPENNKKKQCPECTIKDVNRAKEINKFGDVLFECHDFLEQENWKGCLEKLPKVIDYFGKNGFSSHFPLYHIALDLYKKALVHSVANCL